MIMSVHPKSSFSYPTVILPHPRPILKTLNNKLPLILSQFRFFFSYAAAAAVAAAAAAPPAAAVFIWQEQHLSVLQLQSCLLITPMNTKLS